MKPGPKKQSEVDEDYSNKKAPNQVAFPTFWSAVEPYLRDVREDDLAMLGFKVCFFFVSLRVGAERMVLMVGIDGPGRVV